MMDLTTDRLLSLAAEAGLELDSAAADRLAAYVGLLGKWSAKINLIGPSAKNRLWPDHLAPSLWFSRRPAVLSAQAVADLGSGAGLPGLVLACLRPELPLTCLEARAKRVSFLKTAAAELGLDRVTVLPGRAPDDCPVELKGRFPVLICRAVAPLPRLIPAAEWLTSPDGRLSALKGPRWADEITHGRLDRTGWRIDRTTDWAYSGHHHTAIELIRQANRGSD